MKIVALSIISLLFSLQAFGTDLNCSFEDESGEQGQIEVTITNSTASINLQSAELHMQKQNCKIKKEEYGHLIDCQSAQDITLLLDKLRSGASGGVMSQSLNLFVDINC